VTVASSHDSDHGALMVHKVNSGDPKTFLSHFQPKVPADFMIDINDVGLRALGRLPRMDELNISKRRLGG
jgi:hypothetical protein